MSRAVTLDGLVDEGAVTPRGTVTAADLEAAAEWLGAYEPDANDPMAVSLATVRAWLLREAERRNDATLHRAVVARYLRGGLDAAAAKAAATRWMATRHR